MKKYMLSVLMIASFLFTGCFPEYKSDFNIKDGLIFSCDENLGINKISIWDDMRDELVLRITREANTKKSNQLFLFKNNEGYQSNYSNFKFLPEKTYRISVSYGHVFVEVKLKTDINGDVTEVISENGCG